MEDILLSMKPTKEFLVCVDSDGCVFDNMELKHKECFCPATVNVWGLQSVSRYARESAEFVNLYSKTRGANRFPALIRTLELLGQRKEAQERGYVCPDLTPLKKWVAETNSLSAKGIREYAETHGGEMDPILATAARWSAEVDENIERIVHGVAPLPGVKEAFAQIAQFADIVIVSATPHEAIVREWGAQGLLEHITVVAGQELGSKKDCIRKAMTGKYDADKVLMVGDAPGDHDAAVANDVLYYPIIPGQEVESWSLLRSEAAEKFHTGAYAGAYMDALLAKFDAVLQEEPNW
ncbi:MAG: HAD family hydrolase [Ruminococcaceae bacterium]|nr:HAD family hydrolase [Oscillospiraceae bacterium]